MKDLKTKNLYFLKMYYIYYNLLQKNQKTLPLCVQHKAEPVVRPNNDQKSCTEKYILRTFSHTSGSFIWEMN